MSEDYTTEPRLIPVKHLDYELRVKANKLLDMVLNMKTMYFDRVSEKEMERTKPYFDQAYAIASDLCEHYDILKYNKDILHDPSEKENRTKGF